MSISPLSTTRNVFWHQHTVTKEMRSRRYRQKPCTIFLTGLSGSGKSSIANSLEHKLFLEGYKTYLLDGDNIRHHLCMDIGFSERDRTENIRRIGEVARLMMDAGLITITAFIAPFESDRRRVREIMEDGEFVEVYVNTPLSECEKRDTKGLYRKARSGDLPNFTGISSPYEEPVNPAIEIPNYNQNVDNSADQIMDFLLSKGYIGAVL